MKKIRDTKSEILDAAQELVQRIGANAMSYQHISEAVGIRKASIHHHFPTKEILLEKLLERYNSYFLGIVDEIFNSDMAAMTKLNKYIGLFEATLREGKREKACPCGMLGAELATLGSKAADHVRAFYRENEKRLAAVLEQGRQEGTFTFDGEVAATASLIFSLLEGAMLIARVKGGVTQFHAIRGQLLRFLQQG